MINASSMELLTQPKQSPSQRQNQPNGIDDMDTDRPKDLPEPGLQNTEGPFLQDWWFQFWDIYNSRRNKPSQQTTVGYLAAQRAGQKQRGNMMGGGMDPGAMQNMRQMSMMSNGMMSNDLKKAAMQNAGATNMYAFVILLTSLRATLLTRSTTGLRSSRWRRCNECAQPRASSK